jgi:hypothetical protein
MLKRTLAMILALGMLLTAVSCGKTAEASETTTATVTATAAVTETSGAGEETEPTPKDLLDDLGEKNFGGQTFTILDANDYPTMHINVPGDELTGETIRDAIFTRDIKIEERYGVAVEYVQSDNANKGMETLKNDYFAGDKSFDMCISTVNGGRLETLAVEGILANLCDMPALTLDANWWSRLIHENCRIGDRMYFTSGDIAPATYDAPACVIMNRRLLNENKIETDFYQMVRDGNWTVDELLLLTKDTTVDVNNDGTLHADHDFFGVICLNNAVTSSLMIAGCGVSLCTVEDDTLTVDLNTERTASVTEKLHELTVDIKYSLQQDVIDKAFKSDRGIALIHCLETAKTALRDMESDYIILPMPKYDTEQEGYRSMMSGWVNCFVGFPNYVDTEFVGFVAEAMARESYTAVRPQTYDLVFKLKGVREEGSSEMIDIIFNTLYIDFCSVYDFAEIIATMQGVIFKGQPFASSMANRKKLLEKTVEKFIINWNEASEP